MSKTTVLVITSIVTVLIIVIWNPIKSNTTRLAAQQKPSDTVSQAAPTIHLPAPLLGDHATPKRAPTAEVAPAAQQLPKLSDATSGRAYVASAWQKPELGGKFHAGRLIDTCALVVQSTNAVSSAQPDISVVGMQQYQDAIHAQRRLSSLCSQLTPEDFERYSRKRLLADPLSGDDILAAKSKLFTMATVVKPDQEMRDAATKEILATNDPVLMDELGLRLLTHHRNGKGAVVYFAGIEYPVSSEPAIAAAIYLLPCSLGLDCSSNEPGLALECISGAGCHESRFTKVLTEIAGGDKQKYAEILRYQQELAEAIKNKNYEKFIPRQ
jgi:hypothetical protein